MPDIYINKPQNSQTQGGSDTPPNEDSQASDVRPSSQGRVEELRQDIAKEVNKSAEMPTDTKPDLQPKETSSPKTSNLKEAINQTCEDLNSKKNGNFKPEGGTFAALTYMPEHTAFQLQDPEEEIIMLLRAHPVTNVRWIIIAIILTIIPGFLFGLAFFDIFPSNYIAAFSIFWYLVTISFVFEKFLNWFFTVNFITDERVIDVNFYNLVYKEISSANIDSIQDVSYSQAGTFQSIFNYGNVYIQTAAEKPRFEFTNVPQPERVVSVINDLKQQEEQEKIEGRVR